MKTLLVHLDAGSHNGQRLRVARQLAQQQQAALSALYAVTPVFAEMPMEALAGGSATLMLQEIDESRLMMARRVFEHVATEPGMPVALSESRAVSPVRAVAQQAYYADLLVLGQRDPDAPAPGVPSDFVESVLIASGRPALVLPYTGAAAPAGGNALVCWKESAESARALGAALPLLRAARQVHVARWGQEDAEQPLGGLDIGQYLRRHGIEAREHRHPSEPAELGELMLSLAADLSAEFMVMGCYGHGRARELVLGGATRTVLRSMTVPVLMSH
ncbi:MAG: universal stress protein [Pseudomonadota bacterium]